MQESPQTTVDPVDPVDDETVVVVTSPASAPPIQVWDVLVSRTADWWRAPYLADDAGAMNMEPRLGGRVHVGVDPDRGELHGTIRAFDPPDRLEIGGVLVPGAYAGGITLTITKTNLGSEIRVEHSARGRIEASTEERMAHGWTTMLHALAELADR